MPPTTLAPSATTTVGAAPRALVARGLVVERGGRTVLDGVDLVAPPGRVVAVVGENGSGKSTLLRALAGRLPVERGTVERPADTGHLDQEPVHPAGTTVGGLLRTSLAPLHHAVARLEHLAGRLDDPEAAAAYAHLLEWAQWHDAWDADRRAEVAAAGLGLGGLAHEVPLSRLSGGERRRLLLAALLARRPSCLLLDEPTNHLDDEAATFVEETVRGLPGVVVVASHDRELLRRVATELLDLDPTYAGSGGAGTRHGGGLDSWLSARRAARRAWEDAWRAQEDRRRALREAAATTTASVAPGRGPRDNDRFVHHFKGQNVQRTAARRSRDAQRRLERLDRERVPRPPAPLVLQHPLTGAAAGGSIHVRDLVVPGRLQMRRLDVAPGQRLLVTGANGAGKSTLLDVLAGVLPAASGEVVVRASRVGHLPQDVRFADATMPAARVYAAASPPDAPSLRELGLLAPADARKPVGALSEGQRRRLALALLVAGRHDLLLLDEPTNHLSLTLATELEEALQPGADQAGTVVVASHDRWLRRRWDGATLDLSPCAC